MMNCHMSGCLGNQKHSTTGGGNLNFSTTGDTLEHGGNLNAFNHGGYGEHGGKLNSFNHGIALGSRSASGLLLRACC